MAAIKKISGFVVTSGFWYWVLTQTHSVERVVRLPEINQSIIAWLAIFTVIVSVYMFGKWAFVGTAISVVQYMMYDPFFANWASHWQVWTDLFHLLLVLMTFVVVYGFVRLGGRVNTFDSWYLY